MHSEEEMCNSSDVDKLEQKNTDLMEFIKSLLKIDSLNDFESYYIRAKELFEKHGGEV
jgi:hypothetical protein